MERRVGPTARHEHDLGSRQCSVVVGRWDERRRRGDGLTVFRSGDPRRTTRCDLTDVQAAWALHRYVTDKKKDTCSWQACPLHDLRVSIHRASNPTLDRVARYAQVGNAYNADAEVRLSGFKRSGSAGMVPHGRFNAWLYVDFSSWM